MLLSQLPRYKNSLFDDRVIVKIALSYFIISFPSSFYSLRFHSKMDPSPEAEYKKFISFDNTIENTGLP